MAPQKRNADGDDAASEQQPASELRRSTRGGGHKAPEPKAKPASSSNKSKAAPASKSKKAKTDAAAEAGEGKATTAEEKNGNGKEAGESDKKADGIVADAEKDAKKEGVELPEENKEAAKEKAGKRIEVGETLPEGITLKVGALKHIALSQRLTLMYGRTRKTKMSTFLT